MTATSTHQPAATTTPSTAHRGISAIVGAVSYAVAAVLTVPEAHDMGEVVIVLTGAAILGLVVFGWAVPRGMATGAPGMALGFSVAGAMLLLPAFWAIVPMQLGLAAVMLGRASAGYAPKRSYTALALGAVTVAGYFYLYLVLGLIMGDL